MRRCCSRASSTTPATCSRRYAQLRAVRGTRSIYHNNAIQTWRGGDQRRGEQCPGSAARSPGALAILAAAAIACATAQSSGPSGAEIRFRQARDAGRDRRVGHRRAPGRAGLAAGARLGGAGPGDLRREVRELPRHVRRIQQLPAACRRCRIARFRSASANHRAASSTRRPRCGTTSVALCPSTAPQTLTPDEVYALTAYVLNLE